MKILLIAGHGAGDSGAVGNGYREADLTRELVNIIAPKLRAYASVDIYDQNRNAFYDCQNGTFKIGAYDYVLEVHFNAFNGQAHGTEIYVTDREAAVTVEQAIVNHVGKFFVKRGGSGVKVTNFLVINTVKSKGVSSALIETCFIDNVDNMNVYLSNKDKVANAIVNGIVDGFGLGEAPKPQPEPAPQPIPQPTPTPNGEKYGVGTVLCTNTLSTQANGGKVYKGDWVATIEKVFVGSPYPYRLIKNGTLIGFTNDAGIDSDPHVPNLPSNAPTKSVDDVAKEIVNLPNYGGWGVNPERFNKLTAAGYDANAVQARINQLLS